MSNTEYENKLLNEYLNNNKNVLYIL